ncbi:MAG TPA: TIGR01777 family oxidoreductase [Candidatus Thalassarchaeaceae archaeon]|nr:TIGR01777 family oxidoreductase [Candidatus Thalassarchaeaceae archaeon]
MYHYKHETIVEADAESTFAWFEHEGSFRRLMPPWEVAEEVRADESLEVGSQRVFRFPMGPIKMTWVAEHTGYEPPRFFSDKMVRGPFWSWSHDHHLIEDNGTTKVVDEVTYQVPFGPLGNLADRVLGGRLVRRRISQMFTARELRLQRDLAQHAKFSEVPRKRILVVGSSGIIGTQLVAFLDTGGHDVWRLVRRSVKEGAKEMRWEPSSGVLERSKLEGFDAIIHLGGEGIGDKRWSRKRKKMIRDSRVDSTSLLSEAISNLRQKPEVFILASAIGWYGDRGDEELDEGSHSGEGFLPSVCVDWESAASMVRESEVRTIFLRSGIVLSGTGGALGKMLLPFKMGAGGPMGGGRQWMSWISLDDEIYAIHHLLMNVESDGVYNLTAPNPSRQKNFAKTLGKVLRRPAFAPLPAFVVRVLFGEMGVKLTLESQKVIPTRLVQEGYEFLHPNLEVALTDTLGAWRGL